MLYSVEIGKNVLILRGGRGLSQEELADRAGISVSRLRDIEHGYANASIDVLESVAVALDTELLPCSCSPWKKSSPGYDTQRQGSHGSGPVVRG